MLEDKPMTITQLNLYVKSFLDSSTVLQSVWVAGEISNFTNHYRSGHLYMSLKDEGALVKAVMFKSSASKLRFAPENGMRVVCRGRVSLYERDGQYQLYLTDMQPDGVGALSVAFEQLCKKLREEGLFNEEHKKELPPYPETIAVITSPTGAAVRDIMNILGRRYPLARIVFCPVQVQGAAAVPQLIDALREVNRRQAADVIIIGRGGGSIEELWAFNSEELAREVYCSSIPVISAVGHETDFTICDFAADLRAPTPSAAAELAVPDQNELLGSIRSYKTRLSLALQGTMDRASHQLEQVKQRRYLQHPEALLDRQRQEADSMSRSLLQSFTLMTEQCKGRLSALSARLDALSPLRVLGRGYAVLKKGDRIVDSAAALSMGDRVTLRLQDGEADMTVTSVRKDEAVHGGNDI